jgi:Asp-tRNA(Asn)/Glu-tRNA(Gln) amidotransferase A subunit family amidase
MALMAMGTDTGGSIRIPASFCGCVGLKPTFGRVSKRGVFPLGHTLDHMGPLAASVQDAAISLKAICGYDAGDLSSVNGLRIGRPESFFFDRLDPEVRAAADRALGHAEKAGARVVTIRQPDMEALNAVARVVLLAEASASNQAHWAKRDQFGADVLALLDQGRLLPATEYIQAQRLRRRFLDQFAVIWKQVDCFVSPTTPTAAPKIGETTMAVGDVNEDVRLATTRLVRGINALGYPALSIPTGLNNTGLPMSLQIVGPAKREDVVLRIGAAIERATPALGSPKL